MNTKQRERFLKLIEFLESAEFNNEMSFDFATVSKSRDRSAECPTIACAIGWTPKLFGDLVGWRILTPPKFRGDPAFGLVLQGDDGVSRFEVVAQELFGIPADIAEHLFLPSNQRYCSSDLPICDSLSGAKEVAAMLRNFLELVDQNKISLS